MWAELMILIAFLVIVYLYLFHKKDTKKEIVLAMLVSFAWVCFAGIYNYTTFGLTFGTFNLFPFMLWTVALVLFKELSEELEKVLTKSRYWTALFVIWFAFIVLVEYIGYNWMGIQLDSSYTGLFGLPILHTPLFAKVYYLIGGPVFVWLCEIFEVK